MEWSPIISFDDLGIELCNAKSGRRLRSPIFCKLSYESIPIFYKDNEVFRKIKKDNNKYKYYSMEEVQELYINYIIKNNIEPTGEVKNIINKR